MLTSINPQLEELILNSPSLKKKLSDEQMKKFIDKTRSLPPEGQEELMRQFQTEQEEYKNHLFDAAKQLAELDKSTQEEILKIGNNLRKEAEGKAQTEDQTTEEALIQKLDELEK